MSTNEKKRPGKPAPPAKGTGLKRPAPPEPPRPSQPPAKPHSAETGDATSTEGAVRAMPDLDQFNFMKW